MNLDELAAQIVRVAAALDEDLLTVAREEVSELPAETVCELAARHLADLAAAHRRGQTLDAERAAGLSRREQRRIQQERWEREYPEEARRLAEESRTRRAEIDRQFRESMNAAIDRFREECRLEWTQELLAAAISLPDGRVTTWGDATMAEHQERAEMFTRNALANAEGAARHQQAVQELRAAGVTTLRELVALNAN